MKKKDKFIKKVSVFVLVIMLFIPALQGCKDTTPKLPVKTDKMQGETKPSEDPAIALAETATQETKQEEGYIYQPRDRRDPFVPLIVSTKKAETKGIVRLGTIESYDISEFALLAIAKKSEKYYALLVTPDNRSFTVGKGAIIGLNKGRVEEITSNKIVLVEYAKDFRGDMRPKQITIELKER